MRFHSGITDVQLHVTQIGTSKMGTIQGIYRVSYFYCITQFYVGLPYILLERTSLHRLLCTSLYRGQSPCLESCAPVLHGSCLHIISSQHRIVKTFWASGVPSGSLGGFNPPPHFPQNSEGPPKSCQTQPDCENF